MSTPKEHNQECGCDTHPALKEIYDDIKANQKRIFGSLWGDNINTVVNEYSKLIIAEAVETLQTVNFKAHMPLRIVDKSNTREEAIDVLVYALAQCTALFPSYDDFLRFLVSKVEEANNK